MPLYDLQMKATLDNVGKLHAPNSMYWKVRFLCSGCREPSRNMEFSADEEIDVGKARVNLASKCHSCGRIRTVAIVAKSEKPYTLENQSSFSTIIKFDCRGMEPVEFSPGEGWVAEADSGEIFLEVDLTEQEWVDYDTKKQCPVGIFSLEFQFVKE